MEKRAQAALEFLTTYGWAFLVIMVMIGALAYFGILKPSNLLPERCNFGSEFYCQDFIIDNTNDQIILKIKNNVGEVINAGPWSISSVSLPDTLPCTSGSMDPVDGAGTEDTDLDNAWGTGEVKDLTFKCENLAAVGLQAGAKDRLSINGYYYTIKSGSAYNHTVHGEVYGTAK